MAAPGVAQPGSAPAWDAGSPQFKSGHPDHRDRRVAKRGTVRCKPELPICIGQSWGSGSHGSVLYERFDGLGLSSRGNNVPDLEWPFEGRRLTQLGLYLHGVSAENPPGHLWCLWAFLAHPTWTPQHGRLAQMVRAPALYAALGTHRRYLVHHCFSTCYSM